MSAVFRPRSFLAALAVAAALLGFGVSAQAFDIKTVKSPRGVTAWLIEDRSVPILSLAFAFRGGAALDPEGKAGLAEIASSLLDEGAGPYDSAAFQKRLEDKSISLRFGAGLDTFSGSLRSLTENRDEAVDLLRLALTRPRFDPEPMERARAGALAQVARRSERPNSIAGEMWNRTAFGTHPYARDIDATLKTIPTIAAADLKAFVARRFARDNLVVAAAGDISPHDLARLLDRVFGDLPAKAADWRLPEARARGEGKVVVIDRKIPQTAIQFGQDGIRKDDPDFYAAVVMNHILGGGSLTTRLGDEIREKRGLAYSVYSQLVNYDNAAVIVGATATRNARAKDTIDLIRAEWKRMADQPVSARELDEAKSFLIGSFVTGLGSTGSIARTLLALQLDNRGTDYVTRRKDLIGAVTIADVQRVAKRLLKPEALTFVLVGEPRGVRPTP